MKLARHRISQNFVYDNRGFLASEQHPEKGGVAGGGTVLYQSYDARGHATRKIDGPNDLTFEFDKAERLKRIRETSGGQRPLEIFAYSSSAGSGLAKLTTADRYNFVSINGTAVTGRVLETYSYLGRGGRVSERQTDFFIGPTLANTWKQGFEYTPLGEIDRIDYPYCPGVGCVSGSTTQRSITYQPVAEVPGLDELKLPTGVCRSSHPRCALVAPAVSVRPRERAAGREKREGLRATRKTAAAACRIRGSCASRARD